MSVAWFVGLAVAGGLGMYFGIGGLFEWVYYRRRADAARWKCQPGRWPSPRARRAEIALGTANMTAFSIVSGLLAYYVYRGGYSSIYFDLDTYGIAASVGLAVGYFVLTDGALYWAHRILHRRWLFRRIHRVHHRWTSPTAFTAAAMHPVEFATYQLVMIIPLLFYPIHVVALIAVLVYQNTIAMVDHSGVELRSWLPWQPPARFHDDHHVYFHVNYGQTLGIWDRLFGTWRRQGRVYGANIFGGRGARLSAGDVAEDRIDYRQPRPRPASADGLDRDPVP